MFTDGCPVWLGEEGPIAAVVPDKHTWAEVAAAKTVTVHLLDDKTKEIETTALQPRDVEFDKTDCSALTFLNLPNLLANIRHRFIKAANGEEAGTYTNVGWLLLAVNPYRPTPALYSKETLQKFRHKPFSELPPHPFSVAESAYSALMKSWKSQSIIISGESGAGKTECSKHVLRYLAYLSDEKHDSNLKGIENRVLQSNPVLEAFGNAKTVRNNNSSRFGKLMKLHFSDDGKIRGASIRTYLLANSRVCHVPASERNYHVFYWMCRSLKDDEREALCVRPWHEYRFLGEGSNDPQAIWPTAAFHGLRQSMAAIGLDNSLQMSIFKVLSLILSLGNIDFGRDDRGRFERDENNNVAGEALIACKLLGLDTIDKQVAFEEKLTGRAIVDSIRHHTPDQSKQAAKSVCRALYQRLFDYIVSVINTNLQDWHRLRGTNLGHAPTKSIGILDIFGFEDLTPCSPNSFEQLCINYTNEKIHSFFIDSLINSDVQLYYEEGLSPPEIDEQNICNRVLCDSINGTKVSPGIFQFLDEASLLPSGKSSPDEVFCRRVNTSLSSSVIRRVMDARRGSVNSMEISTHFTISHFVGPVVYTAAGFTFRNTDFLTTGLKDFLKTVPNAFVARELFSDTARPVPAPKTTALRRSLSQANFLDNSSESEGEDEVKQPISQSSIGSEATLVRQRSSSLSRCAGPKAKAWRKAAANRAKTVGSLFSVQVEDLLHSLSRTHAFFIRCIKPNDSQAPRVFDDVKVARQLKSGGIVSYLDLMGSGYPCRIIYEELWKKFNHLLPDNMIRLVSPRDFTEILLLYLQATPSDYSLGFSRAFFRFGLLQQLDRVAALTSEEDKKQLVDAIYRHWQKKRLRRVLLCVRIIAGLNRLAIRRRASIQADGIRHWFDKVVIPRERAATIIQRHWRLYVEQQQALQEELLWVLVTRLQAIWRGVQVRRKFELLKSLVSSARCSYITALAVLDYGGEIAAARMLQSRARLILNSSRNSGHTSSNTPNSSVSKRPRSSEGEEDSSAKRSRHTGRSVSRYTEEDSRNYLAEADGIGYTEHDSCIHKKDSRLSNLKYGRRSLIVERRLSHINSLSQTRGSRHTEESQTRASRHAEDDTEESRYTKESQTRGSRHTEDDIEESRHTEESRTEARERLKRKTNVSEEESPSKRSRRLSSGIPSVMRVNLVKNTETCGLIRKSLRCSIKDRPSSQDIVTPRFRSGGSYDVGSPKGSAKPVDQYSVGPGANITMKRSPVKKISSPPVFLTARASIQDFTKQSTIVSPIIHSPDVPPLAIRSPAPPSACVPPPGRRNTLSHVTPKRDSEIPRSRAILRREIVSVLREMGFVGETSPRRQSIAATLEDTIMSHYSTVEEPEKAATEVSPGRDSLGVPIPCGIVPRIRSRRQSVCLAYDVDESSGSDDDEALLQLPPPPKAKSPILRPKPRAVSRSATRAAPPTRMYSAERRKPLLESSGRRKQVEDPCFEEFGTNQSTRRRGSRIPRYRNENKRLCELEESENRPPRAPKNLTEAKSIRKTPSTFWRDTPNTSIRKRSASRGYQ